MSRPRPLLTVDVGNTRTKFGVFSLGGEHPADFPTCDHFLAVSHGDAVPWSALQTWAAPGLSQVAIAGSNPARIAEIANSFERHGWPSPWTLTDRSQIPLQIDVEAPEKVGMDRLLNAVAANWMRPAARSAVLIDTGTTATIDFVAADGRFCGGAILPGFALSAQALHAYTALLPLLTVRELANDPPVAVGRNTSDAIRSGVYWGHVGAIKEVVSHICRQQAMAVPAWEERASTADNIPWLLLTGGGAPFLTAVFPTVPQVPSLALYGLVLVARRHFAPPPPS